MNLQTFTRAKISNRICILFVAFVSIASHAEDWKIDFSRRSKEAPSKAMSDGGPEQAQTPEDKGFFSSLFDASEPLQEVVILNTNSGFVPSTVRVRQGGSYKIHIVNVNEREKNVSFVLDSFSEHHATFFGKIKTFEIHPKRNGVFRFVSPETSAQGRLVVYPAAGEPTGESISVRQPAAEGQ